MSESYGGHLVARYLKQVEGIDTVFSLSGGHIDRIYDGLLEYGLRLIDVRHEQAAAMMAHAWAIYTGRPGVCLITAGPGFTNVLTGLVNASLENAPLVVLCGSAPIRERERGALQEMRQCEMIHSVVKWYGTCQAAHRIPEYLAIAFRHASTGRPGPVFLELPPDVLNVKASAETSQWPARPTVRHRGQPDPALVREAAALIDAAARPLIVGGSGIDSDACAGVLDKFIRKTGMPFFLANNGRGAVADDHPLSLWDGGQTALLTALGMADLVLVLGIRFNWLLMFGDILPQAQVVRVDIAADEIDRNRQADIGLVGDMELTLRALHKRVRRGDHSAWRQTLRDTYTPLVQAENDVRRTPSDPIHPARLVELVRQAAGDAGLYFVDGGDTSYFGLVGLRAKRRAGVLGTAGGLFGCLGTGIPFGIGAKAALPEATVVVINGDGSFGFNAMEFDTAVRHDLPFICVINNDRAWGMIKHGQELSYGGERVIGSQLAAARYDKLAEALGGHGELVHREEELIPAFERALASGKPACINVLTDDSVTSPATLLFSEALQME